MTQELKKKLLNVVALSGLVAASFPVSEVLQHQATPAVYAQEDQSAPDDEELPDAVDLAAIKAVNKSSKTSRMLIKRHLTMVKMKLVLRTQLSSPKMRGKRN